MPLCITTSMPLCITGNWYCFAYLSAVTLQRAGHYLLQECNATSVGSRSRFLPGNRFGTSRCSLPQTCHPRTDFLIACTAFVPDVRCSDSKDWVVTSARAKVNLLTALCLSFANHCLAGREGVAVCVPMTGDKGRRLRRLRLVHYIHCHVYNSGKL